MAALDALLLNDSAESDEEVFVEFLRVVEKPERRIPDCKNPLEILNEEEFMNRFRLSKDTAVRFLQEIRQPLEHATRRGHGLTPMQQFLITLRFYACGSFQIVVGDTIGVNKSTVCRVVRTVSPLIAGRREAYIVFPPADPQKETLAFYNIAHFPGVVGAIDCTHVKIKSPGGLNAEVYRNRKGVFSINVQTVCNANLQIMDIVARWPGSFHDSTIFDNSRLKAVMESGDVDGYLMGDSGYACRPYLMTPFLACATEGQRRYNRAQISTRNTVERSYGVWKRRFPIVMDVMRVKLDLVLVITVATAVLHNLCILHRNAHPWALGPNVLGHNRHQHEEVPVLPVANPAQPGDVRRLAIVAGHFTN